MFLQAENVLIAVVGVATLRVIIFANRQYRQNGGGGAFHKQRSGGKSVDSLRILRIPVALRQKRCCGMFANCCCQYKWNVDHYMEHPLHGSLLSRDRGGDYDGTTGWGRGLAGQNHVVLELGSHHTAGLSRLRQNLLVCALSRSWILLIPCLDDLTVDHTSVGRKALGFFSILGGPCIAQKSARFRDEI